MGTVRCRMRVELSEGSSGVDVQGDFFWASLSFLIFCCGFRVGRLVIWQLDSPRVNVPREEEVEAADRLRTRCRDRQLHILHLHILLCWWSSYMVCQWVPKLPLHQGFVRKMQRNSACSCTEHTHSSPSNVCNVSTQWSSLKIYHPKTLLGLVV